MRCALQIWTLGLVVALGAPASAQQAPAAPPALPDVRVQPIPETFATSDSDYPPKAKRFALEGVVQMAITVGPDGRISKCAIHRSSGHAELDAQSCAIATQRFRFRPALRKGVPVEDHAILPMEWKLDEPEPAAPPGG